MSNAMFCYQCQETVGNKGCTQIGVCGKKPETAALQDVLVYVTKGLAQVATKVRALGKTVNHEIDRMVVGNLFCTITNANFDEEAIVMVMNRFKVIRWFTSAGTSLPSALNCVVIADSPFVKWTSRSCMAAVSGFLPQTPICVQPAQPAVS